MGNNSRKNSFDARRQNKYSIRRFTVGTASIIVGATILFGIGNEARAAETSTTTQTPSDANGQTADLAPAETGTSAVEAPATDTTATAPDTSSTPTSETPTNANETSSTPTSDPAADTSNTPTSTDKTTTTEPSSTDQNSTTTNETPQTDSAPSSTDTPTTVKEPVQADSTTANSTTPKTDSQTSTAPTTSTEEPAANSTVEPVTSTPTEPTAQSAGTESTPTQQAETSSVNSNDTSATEAPQQITAADAPTTGTQDAPVTVNADGTTTTDLATALQQSSDSKDASTIEATAAPLASTRMTAFSAESVEPQTATFAALEAPTAPLSLKEELEASAIYSPGVWDQTYGYQGNAVVMDQGSKYNNVASQEPIADVNIYLQWTDSTGYVSPVYYTTSDADGRYVIDLSQPQTDALGKEHTFNLAADADIAIRTWAVSPDPTLNVVKDGDSVRGFHKRLERVNESWDFTAGINRIVNSQVILQEDPLQNDWLVKPQADWETSGTADGVWANTGEYGKVSGAVWYDLAEGYGSDARWLKQDSWDVNATGVQVVASYVNDDIAREFDTWKANNPGYTMEQFRAAQQQIVTDYQAINGVGSHIAESVVGTVEESGDYYIPFRGLYGISAYQQNSGLPISHTISDAEYGTLVTDADVSHNNLMAWNGTIGQKHRHINSDYMYITPLVDGVATFGNNYYNNMFTSANVSADLHDAKMLASYSGYEQNFSFITTNPMHDISVEGSTDEVAKPGDVLVSQTEGLFPGEDYQVQWFKDGVAIGTPVTLTAAADGTLSSVPLTVPTDLASTSIYTSGVFSQGVSTTSTTNALALDYILAEPFKQADFNEPVYQGGEGAPGTTVDLAAPTFTDQAGTPVTPPDGTTYAAGTNAPAGVTVNPDGSLSVAIADTEEPGTTILVPVDVTYPDGSVDTVNVPVTVVPQAPVVLPTEAGIDPITGTPYPVTGTGYPGGTVDVTLPDGTVQQTTVNPDGTWTINPTTPLEAGQVVSATQTVGVDYNGQPNVSTAGTSTVVDTTEPVVGQIDNVTAPEDQLITPIPVTVTDASNTTVDVTGLPEGVIYNPTTGAIEGTPTTPGVYNVNVKVTDESGLVTDVPFTFTVTDETAPEVAPITDVTVPEDQLIAPIPVTVTDASNTTVEVTGLPEGVIYNPETGTIEGTPSTPGTYPVTVKVTDEAGNVTEVPFSITVTDETAPVVGELVDQTVPEDQPIAPISVNVTDDSTTTVDVTGLPEGLTYNAATGVIEGTPTTPGAYNVNVKVTDEAGNVTDVPFVITVSDETAPKVAPIDNQTVPEDTAITAIPVNVVDDSATTVEVTGLPEGVIYNPATGAIEGTPTTPGVYNVNVKVTDEGGLATDVPFTITVTDTTAPVVGELVDQTVPEDQPIAPISVNVTDDSATTVDVTGLPEGLTYNEATGVIEGTPTTPGAYNVNVKVTDEAGNVTDVPFVITVTDETAPVVAPIDNQTVAEDAAITPIPVVVTDDSNTTVDVAGLPEGVVYNPETGQIEGTPTTPGAYNVNVKVTDEAGNVTDVPFTITVTDETAPVVAPIDNQTVAEDAAITPIPVVVTDDSATTVEVTGLPEGVVYNPATGQIEGTPTTPGNYPVTVTVTDEAGNVTEVPFTITVTDTTAPVVGDIADQTVPEDVAITPIPVNVTDDSTTNVEVAGLPAGLTYNPATNQIEGTPTTPGVYLVTVTVTDAAGNVTEVPFSITVTDTTSASIEDIADQTVPEDVAITPIPVVVTDDSATNVAVTGLPEGVVYNPETGLIEGTPTTPGQYPVTVVVTDAAGNTSQEVFTITVTDTTAPVVGEVADQTVPEDAAITPIPVEVTDDSHTTVDVAGLPEGVVYNPETGQIEGTPTTPGTYPVTVKVTDEAGNVTEVPFTITVTDETAPVVNPIDNQTAPENTAITPIPVEVADDSATTVEVTGLPEGVVYNPATGQIEGTPTTPGTYPVTVKVTDEAGNVTEVPFTFTVTDTNAPAVGDITDQTVPEDQAITPIPVVVTDDSATNVEVTGLPEGVVYNPETGQIEGTPTTPGTYPVTVKVTDEAGNVTEVPFTITVTDETAPTVEPITNQTVPEDQAITPIPVVVTDDSATTVEVTGLPEGVVYNPETGQIEGTPTTPGTYPVTVKVTDAAGNVTEETFTITVTDETAPEAPVVSPVKDTDTVVSGTGEPNGTVTVTFPDGTTAEAPVDADGNWTVNVPAGTDLKAGDKVTATVTDAAGNTSEPTETTVTTTA
ncbi:putative Ig domain-containing protein, partial [Staphylococcus sp. EZ-P03]|uniref:putative Ig domain-containing protein n=1 Tax=Staphylococcus sp. EZ-P03 TaxID=2282739 RepID=UPI000DF8374F